MRRWFGASLLLAISSIVPAAGADYRLPGKAVPPPPAAFNWSGFYGGVHGGYAWGEQYDPPAVHSLLSMRGGFGGAQFGFNYQFPSSWVWGVEVDMSFGRIDGAVTLPPPVRTVSSRIDYFGTMRTRLGYAWDRVMVYGTGGLAWAHNRGTETFADAAQQAGAGADALAYSESHIHVGYAIGAGAEWAFMPNVSAKLEYLYVDFQDREYFARTTEQDAAGFRGHLLRLGVNWLLGGAPPLAGPRPMPVKAPPLAGTGFTWTGFYLGAHAGYAWGEQTDPPLPLRIDQKGGFGGVQFGYNLHFANDWLIGSETDISFGSLKGSATLPPPVRTVTNRVDVLGTSRIRIGYVADRVLIFGTGGLAWAHNKGTETFADAAQQAAAGADALAYSDSHVHYGYAAGGGVEVAVTPNASAKIEYLHVDLSAKEYFARTTEQDGAAFRSNMVRFGLNWLLH